MEIFGDDKLINIVKYKTKDHVVKKNRVEYVKMSENEVSEIKNIFNSCNALSKIFMTNA